MSMAPDDQTLAAVSRILFLLELPHDPQHDPPVLLREPNDFAEYRACGFVPQRLKPWALAASARVIPWLTSRS